MGDRLLPMLFFISDAEIITSETKRLDLPNGNPASRHFDLNPIAIIFICDSELSWIHLETESQPLHHRFFDRPNDRYFIGTVIKIIPNMINLFRVGDITQERPLMRSDP